MSLKYKTSRDYRACDTVVEVKNIKIGGGNFALIAGPCSVESESQICEIAADIKKFGADILRGGAFKARTSPYDFQGLRDSGLDFLVKAKTKTDMPLISEIIDAKYLPLFENVDILQVGARNMQNFELLKALGKQKKPVLLKRGMSATLSEFLMSAEYIMAGGNENVILCERGIRTFETATRNTLDLSCVPLLHEMTHLPIIVDPSHATGKSSLVSKMSLAAVAVGADGLMIEVHNCPLNALCDGEQSITPKEFEMLADKISELRKIL